MERAIRRIIGQSDQHGNKIDLKSITLAPDVDAVTGAWMSSVFHVERDKPIEPAASENLTRLAQGYRSVVATMDGKNGAFNANGHVVVLPDYGRSLLAGVGAYDPVKSELSGASPARLHRFLPQLLRHEVEHSVTPTRTYGSDPELDGYEEGIAEVLSKARPSTAAARHDLPPTTQWGRVDARSGEATVGWKPHPTKSAASEKVGRASNAVYDRRSRAISDLLKLAGVDQHTRAGYDQARDLLQGRALSRVPGALSDAIIDAHDLDPTVRESLRRRVRGATEDTQPGVIDRIRSDFGISGGS